MITVRPEYKTRIKSIGRTTQPAALDGIACNTRPKINIKNITSQSAPKFKLGSRLISMAIDRSRASS